MKQQGFFLLLFLWGFMSSVYAQETPKGYPAINENVFINTKWKYTYTTHTETNTVIHKADKDYEYFLYFKYDYTYEMFLNGEMVYGVWELNEGKNEIHYDFRKIEWWRIAEFTDEALVLEFSLHEKASYRYHFIQVFENEAPFERAPNELPDVNVNHYTKGGGWANSNRKDEPGKRGKINEKRENRRLARIAAREKRLREKGKIPVEDLEFLQIELVGGGFFGGVDPVYRNNLVIKTNGDIIKEFQTETMGLRIMRREIPRETLEELVTYIEGQGFFSFEQSYTCTSRSCAERLRDSPRPIAMRLAVTKGGKRKLIVIPIWEGAGKNNGFIDYPKEIDNIVKAIEDIALP